MLTEFAKVLQIIRINNDETLIEMAKRLHFSASHLSAIEHGKRKPPDDMMRLMFTAYPLSSKEKEKIENIFLGINDETSGNLTTMV